MSMNRRGPRSSSGTGTASRPQATRVDQAARSSVHAHASEAPARSRYQHYHKHLQNQHAIVGHVATRTTVVSPLMSSQVLAVRHTRESTATCMRQAVNPPGNKIYAYGVPSRDDRGERCGTACWLACVLRFGRCELTWTWRERDGWLAGEVDSDGGFDGLLLDACLKKWGE